MKIFDFETSRRICSSVDPADYYEWVDYALVNKAEFDMPVKSRMDQPYGDYYAVMPCMLEKKNLAFVKMIGRHILKEGESDRSIMQSDLLLYQADTGILKAVMDGEYLTTLRTGAVAAHSALLFAKEDFETVALFGLGNIMHACMSVFLAKTAGRRITLKLYKYHEHELRFMKYFDKYENVSFVLCDTYEDTIRGSDIVISAVTRATENFADDSCYKPGCVVIPIMTLGFQNLDLTFDKVYADDIDQIRGFKYFKEFESRLWNVTDVLNGTAKGRENDEERLLVYNYGLAVHDLYFASQIFENADDTVRDIDYNYCKERFFM